MRKLNDSLLIGQIDYRAKQISEIERFSLKRLFSDQEYEIVASFKVANASDQDLKDFSVEFRSWGGSGTYI